MRFSGPILFFMVFICKNLASQELTIIPDLRFENFNAQRNFTSGYISNIAVDSKGYLWAGGNGLFRFDGVRLQQYTNFNNQYHGLKSNYNDDLITDQFGRLWIGTSMGLCYFNDSLGKFIYLNMAPRNLITHAFSFLLSGNEMWFVCNFGLCKIDLQTLRINPTSLKEIPDPIATFSLDNNLLGISARTGLFLYDIKNDTYKKKIFTHNGNVIRIRQCISSEGNYWVATNKGLWRIEKNGETIYPLKGTEHLNISSMAFHPADKEQKFIWLGTTNNGLQLFNIRINRVEHTFYHDDANPYSLQANNISSMHFDKMERLWLGTEDGVSMFNYLNQIWKTRKVNFREGITADNEIRKIVQDKFKKDKVWMSCINQGILLVDWKNKQILKHYKNFPVELSLSFSDMQQMEDGRWVLLAKNKLIVWNPATGIVQTNDQFPIQSSIPVNIELTRIIQTKPDDLYITTNAGLYVYHPSSNKTDPLLKRQGKAMYSPYDFVHGVYDNKENLWLASRKGLVKYNIRENTARTFYNKTADTANANYLTHIALSNNGLIICANGSGVGLFHEQNETFSMITEFGSVRNPTCNTVFVKDSIAWINSNAGLLQINLVSQKTSLIEMTNQINIFSPVPFGIVNDELVIGSRNMYAYFNPSLIARPVLPGNPVIEKILLNNKPFYSVPGHNGGYSFTHLQNTFSFYFTAFEFNNPEQIHFRYKLEGHDKEWTYQDEQRNATYIRLPPGKYKFIVQAANNQDQWNESAAVFNMNIIPPFWQRWWFWPLIGVVFVAIVIFLARKRINTIRKREEEKTAVNKSLAGLETKLLRSQMNPHFIFNSLNSIQKYIWENKEEDAAEYLAKFAKLIRAILENSRKETITLKEEIDMMKLYVDLEHRRSNGKFEYTIKTGETLATDIILVPPMLLQPFIENAIWHGLNKKEGAGHLDISVIQMNNYLECTIDDDGVGRTITPATKETAGKQSLGMEITRQRIELLHQSSNQTADIRITDKEENGMPAGTTVTVIIPLKYNTLNA